MRFLGSTFAVVAVTLMACLPPAMGQETKPKSNEPDAFQLPDGTIIFYASPDSKQTPTPNSVRLSAKEYASLLDRAARADREARSTAPSECRIVAAINTKNEKAVVSLTFHYRFKTNVAKSTVSLGGRASFPVSARFDSGEVPLLRATDDGYAVFVEKPGEYGLTIVSEINIVAKQNGNEVGFETTLPGAVVTSLTLEKLANAPASAMLTTRSPAGILESKRVPRSQWESNPDRPNGLPLGAATSLELTWDNLTAHISGMTSAEFDLAVHIEDAQIDSVTRIRLKGPRTSWPLVLPPRSMVVIERIVEKQPPVSDPRATVIPPASPTGSDWIVNVPEPGEWLVTSTVKTARPEKSSPGYGGHYPVGPVAVPDAMFQMGKIRFFAPPAVRIDTQHGSEIRVIDTPIVPGESVANVTYSVRTVPLTQPNQPAKPLMTFDVRPAPSMVQIKPSHRFRLTEAGWQLKSDLQIVPVLTEVNQLVVLIPSTWGAVEFGPAELVEAVQVIQEANNTRRLAVRLTSNRKEPFNLALETTIPFTTGLRTSNAIIPVPMFLNTVIRETNVSASVPDGWTVKGSINESGTGAGAGQIIRQTAMTEDGAGVGNPGKSTGPISLISATCDRSASSVTLTWQPYRPELLTTVSAEVTVSDRQIVIAQSMTFNAQSPYSRPIRLRGPNLASGLRATPSLTPVSSGEYTFVPPTDKKTFSLTVSYAVPLPAKQGESDFAIPLLWPEESTRTNTTARIWLPPGKSYMGVKGPWREEPPTPSPDRETWPTETLTSIRNTNDPAPGLVLNLADAGPGDSTASHAIVERVYASAWLGEEGTRRIRARYSFSRWPSAGLEWDLPSDSVAEFWLDGKRIEASPIPARDAGEFTSMRIPMPDSRLGRSSAILDLRLTSRSDRTDGKTISLPTLRNTLFRTSPFWSITCAPGSLALDFRRELTNGMVWKWRGLPYGLGLLPMDSLEDLSARTGEESESDVANARVSAFGQSTQSDSLLRFTTVPRTLFYLICSGGILFFGFVLMIAPNARRSTLIAVVAIAFAVGMIVWPQVVAQSVVAAQPGLLIGLSLFVLLSLRQRWQVRNRRSLSAFERLGVEQKPLGDSANDRTQGSQSRPPRAATPVPVPQEPR
ncbi:MAG: hypothetical protein U0798_18885 [Gemmataceae bacterium]